MNQLETIISTFEKDQIQERGKVRNLGVIYTPFQIARFMVKNAFKIYFESYLREKDKEIGFENLNDIIKALQVNPSIKPIIKSLIEDIKILDPACGSGRFLITTAEYLFKLSNFFKKKESVYEIKKKIIENNIFGNDIDENSCIISKFRLLNWLNLEKNGDFPHITKKKSINYKDLEHSVNKFGVKYNIYNKDFLLHFNSQSFDIIIGNPPFVENKKILGSEYKKKLAKKFHSAYKLYDLSTLFIEQSIRLLKERYGVLTFLTPNKFLAADYGIKIRKLILDTTQIKEIINISGLSVFHKISAYPIILSLLRNTDHINQIMIKNLTNLNELKNVGWNEAFKFDQEKVKSFPSMTIPLSENVDFIHQLFSNFDSINDRFEDLKIIYRPFGFIHWAENAKYITSKLTSNEDLILLGTGNVYKYFIDFKKRIKIANRNYSYSFFPKHEIFDDVWNDLSHEKIIFREIAKDLTFVYDPGIFANLTGLYFIIIPSLNTNQIFSLISILNSDVINNTFKSLYGTLHMSSGYLRINGSFIKQLPIPTNLPDVLSQISKILHFLNQLKYDYTKNNDFSMRKAITKKNIDEFLLFFQKINNRIVSQLYQNYGDNIKLNPLKNLSTFFPDIELKYSYPYYNHPQYNTYFKEELLYNLNKIKVAFRDLQSSLSLKNLIYS